MELEGRCSTCQYIKIKTRYQKINDILEQLTPPGAVVDLKELKNLLIELRDEEKDR